MSVVPIGIISCLEFNINPLASPMSKEGDHVIRIERVHLGKGADITEGNIVKAQVIVLFIDGNTVAVFILVEIKQLPVKYGMKTDYYSEIIGDDVEEGMKVVVPQFGEDGDELGGDTEDISTEDSEE